MINWLILQGRYRDPLDIISGVNLIDILVNPFYLMVIYIVAFIIKKGYDRRNLPIGRIFIFGLTIKILSGLAFAAVYIFYYKSVGDTFYYFDGASAIREAFLDSPILGIKTLLVPAGVFTPDTMVYTYKIPTFWRGQSHADVVFMCKVVGLLTVFTFKTYWLSTIIVSVFSFSGIWKLFLVFYDQYPKWYKQIFFSVILIPSALFWGSGILKDTICIGSLGWLVFGVYDLLIRRQHPVKNILIILVYGFIILNLKAYILFGLLPPLVLWLFMHFRPHSSLTIVKYTFAPFILVLMLGGGFVIISTLGSQFGKYSVDNLDKKVEGFHSYHGKLAKEGGQSGYTLGTTSYSVPGMLSKIPAAINVTYFRPYLWEVSEPMQLISSLESMFFLLLFSYVMLRAGPRFFFYAIRTNAEVAFCLSFALLFGFAVGFTAYNFGALVRFKIPGLPFFILTLILTLNLYNQKREEEKNRFQSKPTEVKG